MRDWLAACVATLCAGGCSFIYNPNNIDNQTGDGGTHVIDAEHVVDVNPAALTLISVYPTTLYEGAGYGSSPSALVVVRGSDISATAVVTVTPASGASTQIELRDFKVSLNHEWIALSLAVPVDSMQDETLANAKPKLPIRISVDNGGGNVQMIDGASDAGLKVQWLDQLTTVLTAPPAADKRYSQINVTAANPFAASATANMIHLRSESSIIYAAGLSANASGGTPGPGGCAGGLKNTSGAAKNNAQYTCSPGIGSGNSGGGGGGHATAGGTGTPGTLAGTSSPGGAPQGSAGILDLTTDVGGGGGGGTALGTATGGGGGGTIFLDAAGDLMISSTVAANGAAGANGGGSGTGGTVVLKSGGTITVTTVTATGAAGGSGGGAGGDGRIRFDAAVGTISSATPLAAQGPMIKQAKYYSVEQTVAVGDFVVAGGIGGNVVGQGIDVMGNTPSDESFSFNLNGTGQATPTPKLTAGYNKVCVALPGGNFFGQSSNCAEVAYLPHP